MKYMSAIVVTLLLTAAAFAQMEPPKPGPELKKLDYFIGNWSSEGDAKPGPMGPGGKVSSKEEIKWMDGGFFVVIHANYSGPGMGPGGAGTGLAIMGYDPQEKAYTYDEFNSYGEAVHSKGTVEGDTWTWVNDMKMGPQSMKGRFTMKILSPTSYSYKFEISPDNGANWTLVMDGKDTKK
jgi:hypothetical protein